MNPAPHGKSRKRRSNPLPSGLLKKMIKQYGPKRAMAEAWKAHRSGAKASAKRRTLRKNTWPKHKAQHKAASVLGWSRRTKSKKGSGYAMASGATFPRHNPFLGEEVLVIGMNPKRKRRKAKKSVRRHTSVARYSHNPRRRHTKRVVRRRSTAVVRRRRSSLRRNPVRRHRRYRRNPAAAMAMGGGLSIMKPQTLLIPIAAVIGGRMAVQSLPAMLGFAAPGLTRYGVQVGIAVGGGMLLKKVVGNQNAMLFTIAGLATVAEGLINQYVLGKVAVAGFAGFDAFPLENGMGAYIDDGGGAYGGGDSPY